MTAALIVASGKTANKEKLEPGKQIGTISAIERVVLLLRQAGIRTIVVCGEEEETKKLVPSMNLVFLSSPQGGEMLDSIQLGLNYLQGKCSQVLIAYVDIPMFSLRTVEALLEGEESVRVPAYSGQRGHPILLREEAFGPILSYHGTGGLKGAIKAAGLQRKVVEVEDAGILSDIQKDASYIDILPDHDASRLRLSCQFRIGRESVFYGPGVHQLLQLTRELGSLLDACRYMGISYSKGRKIIHTMEQQLGAPVIETQQGGRGGGYSRLTERAKAMMVSYDAFCEEAEEDLQALFRRHFAAQIEELEKSKFQSENSVDNESEEERPWNRD